MVVLQATDFWDGDDVVLRLVCAAWRRLWKQDEVTFVDALQASSWAKSPMGSYCTHYKKLALSVAYTPIDGLDTEACRYVFQVWGLGHSRSSLRGAVSAMRALEVMGWLPEFVTGRVGKCAKWATSQAMARPYAGVEELRSLARACNCRAQWKVYGTAILWFTCLPRVGEASPIKRGGSRSRGLRFHTVKCDPHSSEGNWGATAGHGCNGWTVWDPHPLSCWRTSAHKGPPTS